MADLIALRTISKVKGKSIFFRQTPRRRICPFGPSRKHFDKLFNINVRERVHSAKALPLLNDVPLSFSTLPSRVLSTAASRLRPS